MASFSDSQIILCISLCDKYHEGDGKSEREQFCKFRKSRMNYLHDVSRDKLSFLRISRECVRHKYSRRTKNHGYISEYGLSRASL